MPSQVRVDGGPGGAAPPGTGGGPGRLGGEEK